MNKVRTWIEVGSLLLICEITGAFIAFFALVSAYDYGDMKLKYNYTMYVYCVMSG